MQYIEQFVKERQDIKTLRTFVSYFLVLQKIYVSVIKFALQETVHVDTRFSTDTDTLEI